jgi:hypothetical protein
VLLGSDSPAGLARPRIEPNPAWLAAAALAAIALAVLAGAWIGQQAGSGGRAAPAATRDVDIGPARLLVPADWRRAPLRGAGIAGLDPAGTAVFTPYSGAPSQAIVTLAPIDDPSLLPGALRAVTAGAASPAQTTRLAGRPAWLYSDLRTASGDRTMDVTVLPTTAGVIAVACVSPTAWSAAGGECAAPVQGVGLRGAGTLVPSRDLALRLRLPRVLDALDAVRVRAREELRRAATPPAQARWARKLARADRAAAASLRTVAGTAGADLLRSLSGAARAYSQLALAAMIGSPDAFSAARSAIDRAEAGLTASVASRTAPRPVRAPPHRPARTRSRAAAGSAAVPTNWPEIAALAVVIVVLLACLGIWTVQRRASRSWWEGGTLRTAGSRRRTPRSPIRR